jgi:hypothetical protein
MAGEGTASIQRFLATGLAAVGGGAAALIAAEPRTGVSDGMGTPAG